MSDDQKAVIREMATDANYPEYEDIPFWLYDLLERLFDAGWRKADK